MISQKSWFKHIAKLKKESPEKDLKTAILDSIQPPKKKFGIAFSGGIDSSLIAYLCKKKKAKFTCYAVGIENSTDIEAAKKAAKLLKIKLRYKIFTLEEAEKIIKKVKKLLNTTDIVKIGVGAVDYAVYLLAKEDKISTIYTGLGSEEIFAGYERHVDKKDINKECWKGINQMWERDFKRDLVIAEKLKIKFLTPFLEDDVIKAAMAIDGKKKINRSYKKVALRKLAEKLGLPKEIAWRKKQAAQYGSKFDRAILRLARRNGFKFKKDYLKSLS
jgi:asparagine synthase (glutamine-hydrolysing)